MSSNESLPDSGGHYYDEDTGGFVGIARRNVGKAQSALTSGEIGATAFATAVGFVAAKFVTGGIGN